MASLGTLAAELKLEGAAAMMSGLRGAAGAVSGLGQALGVVRAPLARFDGALQNVGALPAVGRAPRLPGVAVSTPGGGRSSSSPAPILQLPGRAPRKAGSVPLGRVRARAPRAASAKPVVRMPGRAPRPAGGAPVLQSRRQPGATAAASNGAGEGDRLARVGGFIGNGGGPSLDYDRRTAAATEKAAQNLQTLVQRWASPNPAAPAAVWT